MEEIEEQEEEKVPEVEVDNGMEDFEQIEGVSIED